MNLRNIWDYLKPVIFPDPYWLRAQKAFGLVPDKPTAPPPPPCRRKKPEDMRILQCFHININQKFKMKPDISLDELQVIADMVISLTAKEIDGKKIHDVKNAHTLFHELLVALSEIKVTYPD